VSSLRSIALISALLLAGCEMEIISEKSSFDWLTDHPELTVENGSSDSRQTAYDHTKQGKRGAAATENKPRAWTVRLAQYEGPFRYDNANALLQRIADQSDLAELWITDIDGAAAVYCGRFRDPKSEQASKTLTAVQQIKLGADQPFANADLFPLGGGDGRGLNADDPWDMSQYKGNYTVIINYYTKDFEVDGIDRFEAAEMSVKTLREDGVPAFYWHTPKNSRVCIGNFTKDQALEEVPNPDDNYQSTIEAHSFVVQDIRAFYPQLSENGVSLNRMKDGEIAAPVQPPLSQVPPR